MKKLTELFEKRTNNQPMAIPENRMNRLRQSFRRRLSDSVEEVFQRACVEMDIRSATGLYGVLEDIHTRHSSAHGYERRDGGEALAKAKAELERCREIVERSAKPA